VKIKKDFHINKNLIKNCIYKLHRKYFLWF